MQAQIRAPALIAACKCKGANDRVISKFDKPKLQLGQNPRRVF